MDCKIPAGILQSHTNSQEGYDPALVCATQHLPDFHAQPLERSW